jgi:sec-independent protein translocase protein TatC
MSSSQNHYLEHLVELRKRFIIVLSCICSIFIIIYYFANYFLHWLSMPLLKYLPSGSKIITTEITAPFIVPIKLAFFVAILIAVPLIFFQLWAFVAPGLYPKEKKLFLPLVCTSIILFFSGMTFCYFIIFPLLFQIFVSLVPKDIVIMTDIAKYLEFCSSMLLIFGATFQIPIIIIFLLKIGLVDIQWLRAKRPYFIIVAFIIGMILTPPDVISMLLLAVPICLLYELGIIGGKILVQ